jgi:hypothetical protein
MGYHEDAYRSGWAPQEYHEDTGNPAKLNIWSADLDTSMEDGTPVVFNGKWEA